MAYLLLAGWALLAHRDGVTLLGDAAHLMPPAGDGANLAMRDAVDLGFAIADAQDWKLAIHAYETVMHERAALAAKNAMRVLVEGSLEENIDLIEQALNDQ